MNHLKRITMWTDIVVAELTEVGCHAVFFKTAKSMKNARVSACAELIRK
jgi:hypothetical protein